MAEDKRIIYLEIDASKAVGGSREATRALEAIEAQTSKAAAALEKMESGFDVAALVAKALIAVKVVHDIADKMLGLFKAARDSASAISDFSEQLGVSNKFVQASMFSAAQHTVAIDKLSVGYTKASQVIGQAAQGQKGSVEMFDQLGVKLLSAGGKLRSTEVILQESAAAILKIEDPARRVTAMIELFGKSGAQLIPMLADIAAGAEAMGAKAAAAGAMIDDKVIKQLAALKSHAEESALKWNALVATLGAPIATSAMEAVDRILGSILGKLKEMETQRTQSEHGVLPESDLKMVQDNAARANAQLAKESEIIPGVSTGPRAITIERARRANLALKNATANAGAVEDHAERARVVQDQYATQLVVSGTFAPTEKIDPDGAKNPAVKGAGQGEADKYAKLIEQLTLAADAQDKMTAAARSGDVAFQDQEIKLKAAEKAFGIYGQALAATDPRLQKIEELISRDTMGKAAQSYVTATTEIEKQNEVLEAEIRLINATIPARAAEIALIKAKQDADKAGKALTPQDVDGRRIAIEQNERLKAQGEELRKANELWTAPLKSALESIQRVGADAFEQMLTNGNFTFQSLGDTFKKIVIRMAAEFMALATIRPVMSVLVNAVSPGMASSMGLSGGGGGGGGGMPGVPSFGDFGGMGGMGGMEFPEWLNGGSVFGATTVGGLMAATPFAPSGAAESVGSISELMASGAAGSSAGLAEGGISGMLAGTSVGSMLGGAMGIGMGAYSLATANGSTGKTIGGIGQMIGGGMMLIPGMQIPGMIVSALATIIPMLIPDAEKRTSSQTNASLRYGSGGYGTTGGAWGPGANVSQSQSALGSLGGNISKVFGLLGGVKDQNKVWGMDASSWTESGSNWSYTSQATDLVDPRGNRSAWRMNESNMYDTASAQVAMRSILEGAVGTISDNMRTAVTAMLPATTTLQDVAKGVVFVTDTYDQLGKAIATIRPSFENLNKQFIDMADTATALGLSLAPVNAERAKQTTRLANDFVDGMLNPLAVQLRAFDDQRSQSLASAEYIRDNVKDVYVDIAKITEYWNRKRIDLEAQYQEASVGQLQALIRRLTYGDLANASPDTSYTGTRGTYNATLAQARAGSGVALNNLAGTAESFAGSARSFFASGPEYAAIVVQLRRDLLEVMGGGANAPASGAANDAQTNALAQQFAELMSAFQISQANSAALQNKVSELTAQLQRTA
jgi:hypothetical protein